MFNRKLLGGIAILFIAYYLRNKYSLISVKEGKIVNTKSGSVRGIISESRDGREFYGWLGIPYAKPPIGPLRFATPQPIDNWDGVREASAHGHVCAQMEMIMGSAKGKEDCLTLNIHVPVEVHDSKKLLPVMFYIHGGYFVSGSSSMYNPKYFMDEDILVVTINYRLAALGFLNTGDAVVRGNMGLKDQSLALKWVNENIIYFGGDPKQITIFGESAGSASVHFHMMSPMSRGLMQKGISASGTALNHWSIYEHPVGQAQDFALKLNCPVSPSTEMVMCLRNVEISDLLQIHRETMKLGKTKNMLFVPTVETILDSETFLPDFPINLVNSGKFERIPWLQGFNADEGLLFGSGVLAKPDYRKRLETDWDYLTDVGLFLTESERKFRSKIKEFYFGSKTDKDLDLLHQFEPLTQLITDRWFSYGHYKAAVAHAQYAPTQVFYYNKTGPSVFDFLLMIKGKYPPMVEIIFGLAKKWFNAVVLGKSQKTYGVCHADDLAMLFETQGIFYIPKGDANYEFSKDLVKTWVNFATAANVDEITFRGTKFPLVNPESQLINVTEINSIPKIMNFPLLKRIAFWESLEK